MLLTKPLFSLPKDIAPWVGSGSEAHLCKFGVGGRDSGRRSSGLHRGLLIRSWSVDLGRDLLDKGIAFSS